MVQSTPNRIREKADIQQDFSVRKNKLLHWPLYVTRTSAFSQIHPSGPTAPRGCIWLKASDLGN